MATNAPAIPRIANAWISDELTLRGGAAHCAEQDYPVMVPAGAFWRP